MVRFEILHGFRLKSAGKVLLPKTLFTTESESEIKELRELFIPHGAAKEIVPLRPEMAKVEQKTVDPDDDITKARGVGAAVSKKRQFSRRGSRTRQMGRQ